MKTRRLILVLLFACLVAHTQHLASNPEASRDQIMKLFEVMHIRQQMRSVMEGVMKQQSSIVRETLKKRYPQMTNEEMAQMDDFILESMKDLPVDGMLDDMIPVYQKHLTRPDVDAMIAFYASPTGQKLMQEMPAMTSEGIQAAYPRMQQQMDKVMQRVEERIEQKPRPKNDGTPKPQGTVKGPQRTT
ncbi:MAG: DUF2059 domain-containing protein [Acidobacteria bacterium]|nr:DUF2059 domain-containing protein [Acidobacteriota bacterium]